jgi:uncharacterized protein (DUF362 family)
MISMRGASEFEGGVGTLSRREFGALAVAGAIPLLRPQEAHKPPASAVAVVKGTDRGKALREALAQLSISDLAGKHVYLKASFNSPDPYPATTHPEMITRVVDSLRRAGCGRITMVERSGMGSASEIWKQLGTAQLARRLELELLPLDDLRDSDWRVEQLDGSHWKRGVEVPRFLTGETCVVQICGANTHRFGGVFSASLKNSIGLVAKYSHDAQRYNYMQELHASPDQRLMIAEVNQVYAPALVVMDAFESFMSGGPESGELGVPGILAVSSDRVAIDAVAVSVLRGYGAGDPIRRTNVFEHEQLKRAAELKIGAGSAEQVRLLAADALSRNAALQIRAVLSGISEEKKP